MTYSLDEFKRWRKALGLTQTAAAKLLGVSFQSVAMVETKNRLKWSKKWRERFKSAYSTPQPPKPSGRGALAAARKLESDLQNQISDQVAALTWGELGIARPESDPVAA